MAEFPSDWPPGCPPHDADDARGAVFRIVRNSVPTPEDFKTHEELGLAPSAPPCARRSVSVFLRREGACHRLRLSPHLGTRVAEGMLDPSCGKMKLSSVKSGHIDWWPYQGVERHQYFKEAVPCP
jgi:hypothetical protein